jgi:hypothetical protein
VISDRYGGGEGTLPRTGWRKGGGPVWAKWTIRPSWRVPSIYVDEGTLPNDLYDSIEYCFELDYRQSRSAVPVLDL